MKKKLLIVLLLGVISISFTGCLSMISPELNNPPVIAFIPNATITSGEAFSYTVEATDPEGDDLTYSLTTNLFTNMNINPITGEISWTPSVTGSYDIVVEVSDGRASDTKNFILTVSPALIGPSNINLTPLTATVGVDYVGTVTVTPGDNTTLTFSLVGVPSGMEISTAGIITWTPTVAGDQPVTVVVTDGAGLSDSKSFIIVVSTANHAPVINLIPDTSVVAGENFTYTVEATDPDGDTLTYSLTTDPSTNMFINENSGVINWIPTAFGSFEITVEVSDGELTDTQSFSIAVIAPDRVVMAELFVAPVCGNCPKAKVYMAQLLEKYGFDRLVVLEEYVVNFPLSPVLGWSTAEISQRYFFGYYEYLSSDETGTPDAYFNGLNHSVHQQDRSYANYEADIEAELTKTPKVAISASYSVTGSAVSISGRISNISSEILENIVIEAMIYEDDVPLVIPDYNIDTIVNHVVRDIITHGELGGEGLITSFSPGDSYQFSLTSSSLSNVQNMNNIHVVVYVQAPNSPTMEILQALYVE